MNIRICPNCGERFQSKSSRHQYCSQKCYHRTYYSRKKTFICIQCKKEFEAVNYKSHFCSMKCANIYHKQYLTIHICPICQKEFQPKNAKQKFCSQYCYIQSRKGKRRPDQSIKIKKAWVDGKYANKKWSGRGLWWNTPNCKNPNQKHQNICEQCGKQFTAPHSFHRKFCSRKCYNISRIGKPAPWASETFKKQNQDPNFKAKQRLSLKQRPTKPEITLINLIAKQNWPIIYTGDGNYIIGYKNPDFKILYQKKLIEVYGNYWHTRPKQAWHQSELGAKIYYHLFGFKTLIIWESELTNLDMVKVRIEQFLKTNDYIIDDTANAD